MTKIRAWIQLQQSIILAFIILIREVFAYIALWGLKTKTSFQNLPNKPMIVNAKDFPLRLRNLLSHPYFLLEGVKLLRDLDISIDFL